jgi:hypothetical protein
MACIAVVAACGSRTGLLVPGDPGPLGDDGDNRDDAAADAGADARTDADSAADAPHDSPDEDVTDALPPVDVQVPEASTNCADAGTTYIYVVTKQSDLFSFYPPSGQFSRIGKLACPATAGSTPFSMAVDHTGIAYVLYDDGELFRVSTATAECRKTAYRVGSGGFTTFGMGYSTNASGSETLFIATGDDAPTPLLGTIDPTNNFALTLIGAIQPPIGGAELTGTGGGDLFGFFATSGQTPCNNGPRSPACTDSAIAQFNKSNGVVTNESVLSGLDQGSAWAFAFWGGDFFLFTAPDGVSSLVTRFRPSDGSLVNLGKLADEIVGAGVSTCAPAR